MVRSRTTEVEPEPIEVIEVPVDEPETTEENPYPWDHFTK